jgi:hypothetical protein
LHRSGGGGVVNALLHELAALAEAHPPSVFARANLLKSKGEFLIFVIAALFENAEHGLPLRWVPGVSGQISRRKPPPPTLENGH